MPRSLRFLLASLLPWMAGCAVGLGEPCSADQACPEGLVCAIPEEDGSPAAPGICDYPLLHEGEPCTVARECEASLTCSNHLTPGVRYGTCTPRLADGSACSADRDCVGGHCAGASGSAVDGTCGPES